MAQADHNNHISDSFNINSFAKYSIKSNFVCDLDFKIMTQGKDGNVLNKTFIFFHSTNMNTLHHSVLMLEILNTKSLPLWPGQMNTQSNVNGNTRNGENYTKAFNM